MYIVTKDGYKLPVDDSSLPEDRWGSFQETVGLYTENTILNEVWIVELSHRDYFANKNKFELEFIKDLKYDHEPSKEEILWAMSAYGCSRGDIAIIRKGYELDIGDDEE